MLLCCMEECCPNYFSTLLAMLNYIRSNEIQHFLKSQHKSVNTKSTGHADLYFANITRLQEFLLNFISYNIFQILLNGLYIVQSVTLYLHASTQVNYREFAHMRESADFIFF